MLGPLSIVTSMKSREVVRYVDSLDSLSSESFIRYVLTVLQADVSVMRTELSSFSGSAVIVGWSLRSADRGRINQIYGVIFPVLLQKKGTVLPIPW